MDGPDSAGVQLLTEPHTPPHVADAAAQASSRRLPSSDGVIGPGVAASGTDTSPGESPAGQDGRWELLRALGAASILRPPASDGVLTALGLVPWTAAEHTQLFILDLPPHAGIHLGPEGKLGGEGAERIAGLWRALGLDPPADPDHLASLLGLYAHLGEAGVHCRTPAARSRLDHARTVLLWEHLASWLPGYLAALGEDPAAMPWCRLLGAALRSEAADAGLPETLPAALREAPAPLSAEQTLPELLDSLVAPVRSGFILTYRDLAHAADRSGAGLRRGERRFALHSLLEQEPGSVLGWLSEHARSWEQRHGDGRHLSPLIADWWRQRARHSAVLLHRISEHARHAVSVRR